jgi:ABC-2 type transport system permease protein
MFAGTIIFFIFIALMMGLVMFVQINPGISGKLGMIGSKATMLKVGEANWPDYFKLLIQGFAGVGLVGIGFVSSWTFGREFSDHTIKDILVVPVSRDKIIFAKTIVVIAWSIILSIVFLTAAIFFGYLIGLPGYSSATLYEFLYRYSMTTILMIPLFSPTACLASCGRGYILALGFVILTLILANFSGLVGLGPWFPWTIPGLFGIPTGDETMKLHFSSYVIILLTGLAGLAGTIVWWHRADHK